MKCDIPLKINSNISVISPFVLQRKKNKQTISPPPCSQLYSTGLLFQSQYTGDRHTSSPLTQTTSYQCEHQWKYQKRFHSIYHAPKNLEVVHVPVDSLSQMQLFWFSYRDKSIRVQQILTYISWTEYILIIRLGHKYDEEYVLKVQSHWLWAGSWSKNSLFSWVFMGHECETSKVSV